VTKEAKPIACAVCSVLAMIAESGGMNADDVSDAYTEGFADGVLAVLKSRRRQLCAAHEGELDATLAERNIRLARVDAARTKTKQ
jgi:hypothetical protein